MIDNQSENRILILGNGFDSANKLKTRYKDFIVFLKNFDCKKWECEKNEEIESLIKNNLFIFHLINIEEELENWMNLEEEIHEIIKAIQTVYNKDGDNYNRKYIADGEYRLVIESIDKYTINVLKEFKLVDNLYNILCISKEYLDKNEKIKWKKLINFLSEQFNGLKKAITLYLKYYVPIEYNRSKEKISHEAIKQIEEIRPNCVFTFNYTYTYKKYNFCNVRHLHGDLDSNNIVLGFYDDDEIDADYSEFTKKIQILTNSIQFLTDNDSELNIKDDFISRYSPEESVYESNHLYFYGFSFDECDREYIKTFLNHSNVSKISIYYYGNESKTEISKRISHIMDWPSSKLSIIEYIPVKD